MRIFKLFTILFLSLLASCASDPKFTQPISPKEGKSVVYVYRPWTFANGAASPPIQLDNVGEEKLANGSFIRFETVPGKHVISIPEKFDFVMLKSWPNVTINLATEANQEYYVRYSTDDEITQPGLYITVIKFKLAFQIVPKELALKELKKQ